MNRPEKTQAPVSPESSEASADLIYGRGRMADAIRHYDWSHSLLGPLDQWPGPLLAAVNLMLNSPLANAVYWGQSLVFLCNDASLDVIGRQPEQVLGVPARQVWGDHWASVASRFEAVLERGEAISGESVPFAFKRTDKPDTSFLNYALSPIYHQGAVAGVYRTLEETTETVLALRALSEADERLRMALSAGNGIGTWDWHIQSGIVYSDEIAAGLYGIDPKAAAAGTSNLLYERMLHPDDLTPLTDAILGCITAGKDYSVDYRVRREDDTYRWVRSNGRCVFDENGHAYRVTGIMLDVTGERHTAPFAVIPENLVPEAPNAHLPPALISFVAATANVLTDDPTSIRIEVEPGANATRILLKVPASDLGKVIGKQGNTMRAVRTLLNTYRGRTEHRFSIDVEPV